MRRLKDAKRIGDEEMKKHVLRALSIVALAGAALPAHAQAASGSGSITVIRPLTVTKNTDMAFGTVIRPTDSSGNGTVSVSAAASTTRSVTGSVVALASSTASSASFTISGEGGQTVSVAVPATFTMTSGSNSLTVTTSNDLGGTSVTLTGSLGSAATKVVNVGGSVPIAFDTPTGAYSGSFTVTASYN